MHSYPFSGNFRELEHVIENAFYKSMQEEITSDCFELEGIEHKIDKETTSDQTIEAVKREHISKILNIYKNRKKSAEVLGISVRQIY